MKSRSAASVKEQFFNFHYEDGTDYDTLSIAPSPCTISYLPTIQGASSVQTEPDSDERDENCKEPQKIKKTTNENLRFRETPVKGLPRLNRIRPKGKITILKEAFMEPTLTQERTRPSNGQVSQDTILTLPHG